MPPDDRPRAFSAFGNILVVVIAGPEMGFKLKVDQLRPKRQSGIEC